VKRRWIGYTPGVKTENSTTSDVSNYFVARHWGAITGILHCWDRLRFSGTLRTLQSVRGMMGYLWQKQVRLKEFKEFAENLTQQVRREGEALAKAAGRSVTHLRGYHAEKDEMARAVARRDGVGQGLIGLWTCTESCLTYFLRRDAQKKELALEFGSGKCLHHYFYFIDPVHGLMHLRLQTWFPFNVTLCLNGHEWLARQMEGEGLKFARQENCFRWLEDPVRAQELADAQQHTTWAAMLDGLLGQYFPSSRELSGPIGQRYYWSAKESEFSSDVLFASAEALGRVYPFLTHYGLEHFKSRDVLRFLGRRVPKQGVHGKLEGEVNTSFQERVEGARVKHYAQGNTLKMYDKEGSVLRVETTINRADKFKVYREGERDPQMAWRPLRKGVADLHRRATVSRAANERYLEALAQVETDRPLGEVADTIFRRVKRKGRSYRALNPWASQDAPVLEAISDGAWEINGLSNRELRKRLFPPALDQKEERRLAAKTTRLLALLRAHGLIKKVSAKTHRYRLSDRGRQITAAMHTARGTSFATLEKLAA
jgi:hypothetical protein